MESHPPLGKLLIAAGEALISPNSATTQFLDTDYAKNPPAGFSFLGFRLIPAVCAALVALLLYGIFFQIAGNALRATCLCALYIFDNAIVVHSRAAMLEGIQLFFICAAILSMLQVRKHHSLTLAPLLMGAFFGCALATKENAIFIAPLLAIPLWRLPGIASRLQFILLGGLATAGTIISVWAFAFSLSTTIHPKLEGSGWYQASPELQSAVLESRKNPVTLYYFIRDNLKFAHSYHTKVPRLNYCKADENGSYPLLWPLGARSINYRWEKLTDGSVRYLFLQANPVVWGVALSALLAALAIVGARALGAHYSPRLTNMDLLSGAVVSHLTYLAATLSLDRVFYLYHYFVPLLLCFILAAALLESIPAVVGISLTSWRRSWVAFVIAALSLFTFFAYKPLTYYQPIGDDVLRRLQLLSLWDLIPVDESKTNPFARPLPKGSSDEPPIQPSLHLDGLKSISVTQSWGVARSNETVDYKPLRVAGVHYSRGFGVHAESRIKFPTAGRYARFTAKVGVPDEVQGTNSSVIFKVLGDGVELWSSPALKVGEPAVAVELPINGVSLLTLEVLTPGTSIDHAHACWLEPNLLPE
ncbi:MAG: phospholipid carrier-dependent glycosyltransferase [Proteobacteria bacterium]|nr:phospholipid carrier-dependent glycosyltransferase [Pseudomonadota bacterium]